MLELFKLDDDGLPKANLELKTLVPFKEIIERDRGVKYKIYGDPDGRKKFLSTLEFAYIYYESDYQSPYKEQFYEEEVRLDEIKKAVGLPPNWLPDKIIQEACDYYRGLQKTRSMIFLESAEQGLTRIKEYLDTVDLTLTIEEGPKRGELVHDVNKYRATYKEMPELIKSYYKTLEMVKEELEQKKKGKGGRELGMFAQSNKPK